MADKFSWAHLSDTNLRSASSETCTDLSDANLPSAFSETCTDLSDANLPSAFSETGWSISSLVKTTCSLSHIAEENLDRARTTHFRDFLAKNDVLFKKKSHYHPGQIVHLQKRDSVKLPACRIILPPFPLKRRWSELALPTFMMASKNGNIVQQDECVNTNATETEATDLFADTSKGIRKEAEIEETGITISFSLMPLDVLSFLEDTTSKQNPGCSILELTSTKDHLQEAPIVPKRRNRRRLWKWVRRQIIHSFRRLFLCFSTRSRRHTTSRINHWVQARRS
ncbi:uncharacterized protein LOC116086308 [Mastomys coucha]|uniref:uncharacterized protein LOC116086308 n=1 Tax=Mastomys coucha TaxID=35658 RepID=UPI001261C08F|nr:uncharacterized protein LOC116086308 [Mastomys coucha]